MAISDREMGAPTEVIWQKHARESEREQREREREREKERNTKWEEEEQACVLMIHVMFTDGKK